MVFLDYLLRIVDQSRSPFSLPTFVGRVLDAHFVPTERYAALLVKEIPQNKRVLVCREIFARRNDAEIKNVRVFLDEAFKKMSADEIDEICEVAAEELRHTTDDDTIRFVVGGFPSEVWPRLDETARLRIENKLIGSVAQGKWLTNLQKCKGGGLGTWTVHIIHHLTLKEEFWTAVFSKLRSSDRAEQDYAFNYFAWYIDKCNDAPPASLKFAVNAGLNNGDSRFKSLAEGWKYNDSVEERDEEDPWRKSFEKALANFQPSDDLTDDDIPF